MKFQQQTNFVRNYLKVNNDHNLSVSSFLPTSLSPFLPPYLPHPSFTPTLLHTFSHFLPSPSLIQLSPTNYYSQQWPNELAATDIFPL